VYTAPFGAQSPLASNHIRLTAVVWCIPSVLTSRERRAWSEGCIGHGGPRRPGARALTAYSNNQHNDITNNNDNNNIDNEQQRMDLLMQQHERQHQQRDEQRRGGRPHDQDDSVPTGQSPSGWVARATAQRRDEWSSDRILDPGDSHSKGEVSLCVGEAA
jgi:hypothetical protein